MANTLKFGNGQWAVKEGSTLAYNDENNNFKPLPFNFERDSRATRVNKDGLIETVGGGEPRIDFLGNTKGTLLLEPQRTNLFLNSEPTSNENASGGITYESFNWFLGFSNCIKFGDDSSLRFRYGATVSATTQHTISAFVIMDDLSEPLVGVSSVTGDFAFVCGGVTGGVANENIYYGNNIYRVSTTLTSGTNANNSGIIKYTSQSSKGFRVVGLQIEQESYPTSYIPTQGSAVTRLADVCNGAGNEQVFNDSEGVLFAEISALANDGANRRIAISDGDNTDRISIGFTSSNRIQFIIQSNNSIQVNTSITVPKITENTKVSFKYKANDCAFWIDGFELGTDTIATMPSGLNVFSFDEGNGGNDFYGKTKQIQYYNTALTDAELKALTS